MFEIPQVRVDPVCSHVAEKVAAGGRQSHVADRLADVPGSAALRFQVLAEFLDMLPQRRFSVDREAIDQAVFLSLRFLDPLAQQLLGDHFVWRKRNSLAVDPGVIVPRRVESAARTVACSLELQFEHLGQARNLQHLPRSRRPGCWIGPPREHRQKVYVESTRIRPGVKRSTKRTSLACVALSTVAANRPTPPWIWRRDGTRGDSASAISVAPKNHPPRLVHQGPISMARSTLFKGYFRELGVMCGQPWSGCIPGHACKSPRYNTPGKSQDFQIFWLLPNQTARSFSSATVHPFAIAVSTASSSFIGAGNLSRMLFFNSETPTTSSSTSSVFDGVAVEVEEELFRSSFRRSVRSNSLYGDRKFSPVRPAEISGLTGNSCRSDWKMLPL